MYQGVPNEVPFRFVPGARLGTAHVELLGEVSDWRSGLALERQPDGSFTRTLDVPAGVYQYKLLVDGDWVLDPSNTRTRSAAGGRNNLLVVGGAEEPLLFAPAPPWVEALERGGVRVLAGVRKQIGTTPALTLRFSEDDGARWSTASVPSSNAFDTSRSSIVAISGSPLAVWRRGPTPRRHRRR